MAQKIAIVGAGRIGRVLEHVLHAHHKDVILLHESSHAVLQEEILASYIPSADIILLCVPSWATREVVQRIVRYARHDAVYVSFAKGIEEESMMRVDEVLHNTLPAHHYYGVCGGPMMAEELAEGFYGISVLGAKEERVHTMVQDMCSGTHIFLEFSHDVKSVAYAGVLKNVYVVALGIIDGLQYGTNAKGFLLAYIVEEMKKFADMFSLDEKIVCGVAGLSDLIATGFSPHSRNRRTGSELVATGGTSSKSEGITSFFPLCMVLGERIHHFPILCLLREVLEEKKDTRQVFSKIFKEFIHKNRG